MKKKLLMELLQLPMKTLSPADPSPSVAVEGVSLFLDFPAELVGAVAGDSVLSLLQPPEVASLFLVLVAAPVEVASEAVDILSLLIEGVVVFL